MSTVNGTIRGTLDENVGQPYYLKNYLSHLAEILYVVLLPNENCRVKTFQRSITLLVFDENDSDLAQVVDRFCIKHFHFGTVAVE